MVAMLLIAGVVSLTFSLSVLLHLLVEKPASNIDRIMFPTKRGAGKKAVKTSPPMSPSGQDLSSHGEK
jgi:peptidoglycan/LPS O-acetylase OafA/YrhL